MKALKWLDEHFEEFILIIFLILISCIELMQVICRNAPFVPSLTWAEELCRFLWIATVFISVPYTIRTATALRVTALIDILPWKVRNIVDIVVDAITAVLMAVMTYYSVVVLQRIVESGEVSPAILLPMWIMYLIVLIGFALAVVRSTQMFIIHIKNVNVEPADAMEEQAKAELAVTAEGASVEGAAIEAAFTMTPSASGSSSDATSTTREEKGE